MSLFGLFKKKSDETKVGNVEDFISLTRVYFQSVIATNLGITNIRVLPDGAIFKRLFKIPTQGGKLGLAEKSASRKMLMQDYGLNESFFKEIDASVKRNMDRRFTNLMICFGCTGGQHRSVYSAQHMAEHIHSKFGVRVDLVHRELIIVQLFNSIF